MNQFLKQFKQAIDDLSSENRGRLATLIWLFDECDWARGSGRTHLIVIALSYIAATLPGRHISYRDHTHTPGGRELLRNGIRSLFPSSFTLDENGFSFPKHNTSVPNFFHNHSRRESQLQDVLRSKLTNAVLLALNAGLSTENAEQAMNEAFVQYIMES